MPNIMKRVHALLNQDPLVRKHIRAGLINHRALARTFQTRLEQKGMKASLDAVISAIRRYETPDNDVFEVAEESLKNSKVASRTKLVILQLGKTGNLPRSLGKAIALIDYRKGEVLRVMQGEESAKILIDEQNLEKIKQCFNPNTILSEQSAVGEVSVVLAEKARKTPGVTSLFASALAVHNINIVEVVSCLPEYIWVFHEEDLLKAHKIIFDICKNAKSIYTEDLQ